MNLSGPTNLKVESGDGTLTFTWDYSGIGDEVTVGAWPGKWAYENHNYGRYCSDTSSAHTCTLTGLKNGTLYYLSAHSSYEYEGMEFISSSDSSAKTTAMPLPVMSSAIVTPGSKSLTVQYNKVDGVDGHIIQLYRMSGTKAKLVKTVTSTDKYDTVTVTFKGLSNNTTYRVCISSYLKFESKVYRSAVASYNDIVPSENAAASKDLIGVSGIGKDFDGFVDPVGEAVAEVESEEAIEAVEDEVKEEETRPSIFDLFRLW